SLHVALYDGPHCRIEPFFDQGGSAALRRARRAPGSVLGRPARRAPGSTRSRTPVSHPIRPHSRTPAPGCPAGTGANNPHPGRTAPEVSSASDHVALQDGPVKAASLSLHDGASATHSPAPPDGFRQLSDEGPPRLS